MGIFVLTAQGIMALSGYVVTLRPTQGLSVSVTLVDNVKSSASWDSYIRGGHLSANTQQFYIRRGRTFIYSLGKWATCLRVHLEGSGSSTVGFVQLIYTQMSGYINWYSIYKLMFSHYISFIAPAKRFSLLSLNLYFFIKGRYTGIDQLVLCRTNARFP